MPDFKDAIRRQLTGLDLAPARETEIVDELSQHLEDEYDDALSKGATEEQAEQTVLQELRVTDLLGDELKKVERRTSHEPIVTGAETKANILSDVVQDLR